MDVESETDQPPLLVKPILSYINVLGAPLTSMQSCGISELFAQ